MAADKGLTTLSHDGKFAKTFGDGKDHTEGFEKNSGNWSVAQQLICRSWPDCLFIASVRRTYMQKMNLVRTNSHLRVEECLTVILSDTSGYAFAISYQSDISKVTLDNLVIFTTNHQYAFFSLFRFSIDSRGAALLSAEWLHTASPQTCQSAPKEGASAPLSGSPITVASLTNLWSATIAGSLTSNPPPALSRLPRHQSFVKMTPARASRVPRA